MIDPITQYILNEVKINNNEHSTLWEQFTDVRSKEVSKKSNAKRIKELKKCNKQQSHDICELTTRIKHIETILDWQKKRGSQVCKKISKDSKEYTILLKYLKEDNADMNLSIKDYKKKIDKLKKTS